MADAKVYVRYLADASKLVTETKKASKSTRNFGDDAARTDKSFGKFAGRAATFFAGSAALAGISAWALEGAKLADTADLVRSSWDKTFQGAGPQMVSALEDQRKALGLAEYEMQKMLLTTGQLAQQQGMSKEESAKFSQELFTMAGDVAAFNGALDSSPEVLGAFQAALRGEFDPLEAYGIKLSAAAIEQKALEMTGKESTKMLTNQEKQAAILALIQEALGDETGALAEAMATGATKQNELNAEMKDGQEAIGQTVQVLRGALNSALLWTINGLESVGAAIGRNLAKFQHWAQNASGFIGSVGRFLSDLVNMMFGVGNGAARMGQRMRDAINSILGPISGVSRAVGGLLSKIGGVVSKGRSLLSRLPGFATGGMVGGPVGKPQLAVVHGGEQVLTPAQQRAQAGGGAGGQVFNITVNAGLSNPYETATQIVDLLRVYQRTQGPLPYAANTQGDV